MPFNVPNFNLICNIWKNYWALTVNDVTVNPVVPSVPADIAKLGCQLYINPRSDLGSTVSLIVTATTQETLAPSGPVILLRLPAGTDIAAPVPFPTSGSAVKSDYVEVPAGKKLYYVVTRVVDMHKGFPNEYRVAVLSFVGYAGIRPIP